MSKSVLVIETPESCRQCNLRYHQYGIFKYICKATVGQTVIDNYEEETKPNWCPLRPLPSYKNLKPDSSLESQLLYQFNQGYNTCLQEMEGEEK